MFWHFLGWKNKFFQNCSKLPKNHFRTIKILFFFPDFLRLQGWGGWVRPNLENSRFFFFFEHFPYHIITQTSYIVLNIMLMTNENPFQNPKNLNLKNWCWTCNSYNHHWLEYFIWQLKGLWLVTHYTSLVLIGQNYQVILTVI